MQDKVNKLYNIDNIEFLKTLADKSAGAIVSDVPYALCDIDALKMIKEGTDNKGDFMNKKWTLPTIPFLKECNRVLKDGAFFITTFSPRQDLQCVFSYRLLEAGFDINFTPILWCQVQGFPKASDYQKISVKRLTNELMQFNIDIENYIKNLWLSQDIVLFATDRLNLKLEKGQKHIHKGNFAPLRVAENIRYKKLLQLQEQKKYIIIAENVGMLLKEEHHTKEYIVPQNVKNPRNQNKKCEYVTDVELSFQDVNHNLKNKDVKTFGAVVNVNQNTAQLLLDVIVAELNVVDQKAQTAEQKNIVLKNVLTMDLEKLLHKIKVEEVLKIESGKCEFLMQEILSVLYAEIQKDLKPIILSQLKHTPSCDTTSQMDYAFVTNVIITKSTMECLITSTVNTLATKLKEEQEQASEYLDGLKSLQLKPAYEVVIIAQKPYKAKSKIDQALVWYNERKELLDKGIKEEDLYLYTKNASGGVRIDKNEMFDGAMSSRIPTEELKPTLSKTFNTVKHPDGNGKTIGSGENLTPYNPSDEGRFPATILAGSPIDFCEQDILDLHTTQTTHPILFELLDYIGLTLEDFKALSKEELKGIIAKLKKPLDVGRETKSGKMDSSHTRHTDGSPNGIYGKFNINHPLGETHADKGDLSRYFSLDAWTKKNLPELYKISKKTLELQEDAEKINPFLFTSKADKGSKNAGLEGFESQKSRTSMSIARGYCKNTNQVYEKCQCGNCDIEYINNETNTAQNTHPTGKSIALYSYLVNLFTFPNDLVLDPYCGSGTTPIACVLTNRRYIGLELEKEYFDIAEARVKFWKEQKECQEDKPTQETLL